MSDDLFFLCPKGCGHVVGQVGDLFVCYGCDKIPRDCTC